LAYATVDELAAAIRTRVTPTSTPVLERCLDAATEEIDHYLDVSPTSGTLPVAGDRTDVGVFDYSISGTVSDPGAGKLAIEPATLEMSVSTEDRVGADVTAALAGLEVGEVLMLQERADALSWGTYDLLEPAEMFPTWAALTVAARDVSNLAPIAGNDDLVLTAFPLPPPTPAAASELVHAECIARAVEWYKANDAALGIAGYNDAGTLTPPASTFDRHASILAPLVEQWGIA